MNKVKLYLNGKLHKEIEDKKIPNDLPTYIIFNIARAFSLKRDINLSSEKIRIEFIRDNEDRKE